MDRDIMHGFKSEYEYSQHNIVPYEKVEWKINKIYNQKLISKSVYETAMEKAKNSYYW